VVPYGIQAAAELQKRKPELKIVMLSMHDGEQFLFESLKAGASGCVLKSGADTDIVDACRAAMRGESYLYPSGHDARARATVRSACSAPRSSTSRWRVGRTAASRCKSCARVSGRSSLRNGSGVVTSRSRNWQRPARFAFIAPSAKCLPEPRVVAYSSEVVVPAVTIDEP
jgi:hypothetical protein